MQRCEIEIIVRSTEIDVNGHVNNATYLEYLEWGREDWFEQNGCTYEALLAAGAVTVVARVLANYRREAVQRDVLQISACLVKAGRTSLTVRQEIRNQRDELVMDANLVIVTVDAKSHRPVQLPDLIRRLATTDLT